MKSIAEILKSKGITEATKFHNYEYLYNMVKICCKEYAGQFHKPDVSGELPTIKQWAKIEQDFYDWKNECENRDNSESWTPSNYELFNFIKNKIVGGNFR